MGHKFILKFMLKYFNFFSEKGLIFQHIIEIININYCIVIYSLQLHLIQDPSHRVRVSALHTLTKCLSLVSNVPPSDTNVFPEYILPALASVSYTLLRLASCTVAIAELSWTKHCILCTIASYNTDNWQTHVRHAGMCRILQFTGLHVRASSISGRERTRTII